MHDKVRATFEEWKRRLLDLSGRNRLLHFRPTKRGTLRLPGVPAETIYDELVVKGAQIIFEGVAEDGVASAPQSPGDAALPLITGQHGGIRLRVTATERDLKRTLTNLHRRARESILEQGIHTLYVALGFLEWYEDPASDVKIKSPLLLIPVELDRQRGGTFALAATGDAIESNIVLAEKLRRDMSIQLPEWHEAEDESSSRDLPRYIEEIRRATRDLERSSVHDEAVLDIFSFAKLVMYRDLERHTEMALGNKLVQALCGAPTEAPDYAVPSGMELDERIPYADCFHVLDADTSQREAIAAASLGESFILVGPPGTGKSQTIANIIAECIAKGKKVLFVSEKAAALEVVYRRLEERGLHPFCLDLHSSRGHTREVLEQLRSALEYSPACAQPSDDFWALEARRRELNSYVMALHQPFGALGWTPFQIHGKLAQLDDVPRVTIALAAPTPTDSNQEWAVSNEPGAQGAAAIDGRTYAEMEAVIGDIQRLAPFFERGEDHPWWGYKYVVEAPSDREKLRKYLDELQQLTIEAATICAEMSEAWGIELAETVDGLIGRDLIAECLMQIGGRTLDPSWLGESLVEHRRRADEAAAMSATLEAAARALWPRYSPALLEVDVEELADRFSTYERSWWRRTFGSGRDRRMLRQHLTDQNVRLTFAQMAEDVRHLNSHAQATRWFQEHESDNRKLFGVHYHSRDTDWAALGDLLATTASLNSLVRDQGYTPRLETVVTGSGISEEELERLGHLRRQIARLKDRLATLVKYFLCDSFGAMESEDVGSTSIADIRSWAEARLAEFGELDTWQRFRRVRAAAQRIGLQQWVEHFLKEPEQVPHALAVFRKSFALQLLDEACRARPALGQFAIEEIERVREEFRARDEQAIADGAARVTQSVLAARGDVALAGIGQVAALRRELRKQRRHKPVRQLLSEVPELVQDLTPCMMMSPLTVSQYLGTDRLQFDLVVFDEASQVRPQDALPAVMRASQLILAGDPKQLPPTTFFEASLEDADDDDVVLDALESVLDEAGVWLRERLLRWHYRSRDDTLIAFSNYEFYENRLVTFPDAGQGEALGIRFVHCPDGVYDRGGSRTNQAEANRVRDLVAQTMEAYPHDSIGVVAFSKAQEQAIWDAFEARAERDARFEAFLSDNAGPEPFFIKNLETVQGDERDTIIISVGYGRDAQGRLTMNFGPLNQEGGARRLNVAVTRARKRVILVSSMTAQDIAPDVAGGAQLLRRYLDFAARGVDALQSGGNAIIEAESPFEEAVRSALVERGLDVRSQVGCGPYRIDLAVVDPQRPGQYLLGVECDGRTYHSSQTARDRDRLREQVLEDHGWRLVRIWSTDWWRDPQRQVERVVQAVAAAAAETAGDTDPADGPQDELNTPKDVLPDMDSSVEPAGEQMQSWKPEELEEASPDYGFEPYVAAELGLLGDQKAFYRMAETRDADLLAAIRSVVSVESPVHFDVAMKRVTEAFGISRCGSRVRELMDRCVSAAQRAGQLRLEGDFLWSVEGGQLTVRTNETSTSPRHISEFALEELALAIGRVVETARGALVEDVIREVARALGFGRTGRDIRERLELAVALAEQQGLVERAGDELLQPED